MSDFNSRINALSQTEKEVLVAMAYMKTIERGFSLHGRHKPVEVAVATKDLARGHRSRIHAPLE